MPSLDQTPLTHLKTSYQPHNALWMAKIAKAVYMKVSDEDEAPNIDKIIAILKADDQKFIGGVGFNAKSSQGAIIQHEDYMVAAFRGTDEAADWLDNINALPKDGPLGSVHAGFHNALMDIWSAMRREIRKIRAQVAKDRETKNLPKRALPLWITGHSLGAAMATLAAAHLVEADEPFFGVYTFGSPRCGDRDFARTYNVEAGKRTFRFQNNNDIVTRVPARLMGYSHVGTFIYRLSGNVS
ncbi:lipase [Candidatus Entotheonella serta]|nr:lipase [Candidatus Entotheonella serta]